MQLVGPWLSTTATRQRGAKLTKAKMAELEQGWRERNQRLKEMHLPKETFEQYLDWVYGRGKKTKEKTNTTEKSSTPVTQKTPVVAQAPRGPRVTDNNSNLHSVHKHTPSKPRWITGAVSSKPSPVYTGSEMIGLTVIHKSCIQPVFNKEAAIDAAKMRR